MRCLPKVIFAIVLLGAAGFVGKLLQDGGAFRHVTPGGVLKCERSSDPLYDKAEDLEMTSDGWLYLSTSHGLMAKGSQSKTPEQVTESLLLHGISLSPSGQTIFAVDHSDPRGDQIRVYSRTPGSAKLNLKKSVPMLRNLNDLAAVDDERVFVTMDHGAQTDLGRKLEDYSRMGRGSIFFFDGKEYQELKTGISFANGIVWSPKDRMLYVAAMLERRIYAYSVSEDFRSLTEKETIDLDFGPDNLSWDDGQVGERLLVTGHPSLLALAKMRGDSSRKSPSMVWELTVAPRSLRLLYADDGKELAASSTTIRSGKDYIIGSVFDDHIAICREKE